MLKGRSFFGNKATQSIIFQISNLSKERRYLVGKAIFQVFFRIIETCEREFSGFSDTQSVDSFRFYEQRVMTGNKGPPAFST